MVFVEPTPSDILVFKERNKENMVCIYSKLNNHRDELKNVLYF
jgi:hypothetical protein